jgi:hypothetical protein
MWSFTQGVGTDHQLSYSPSKLGCPGLAWLSHILECPNVLFFTGFQITCPLWSWLFSRPNVWFRKHKSVSTEACLGEILQWSTQALKLPLRARSSSINTAPVVMELPTTMLKTIFKRQPRISILFLCLHKSIFTFHKLSVHFWFIQYGQYETLGQYKAVVAKVDLAQQYTHPETGVVFWVNYTQCSWHSAIIHL